MIPPIFRKKKNGEELGPDRHPDKRTAEAIDALDTIENVTTDDFFKHHLCATNIEDAEVMARARIKKEQHLICSTVVLTSEGMGEVLVQEVKHRCHTEFYVGGPYETTGLYHCVTVTRGSSDKTVVIGETKFRYNVTVNGRYFIISHFAGLVTELN